MTDSLILLNNHRMRGHDVQIIETTGKGHSATNPNFCCTVMVGGKVEGLASGYKSKREAKAAAATAAAESLGLV